MNGAMQGCPLTGRRRAADGGQADLAAVGRRRRGGHLGLVGAAVIEALGHAEPHRQVFPAVRVALLVAFAEF